MSKSKFSSGRMVFFKLDFIPDLEWFRCVRVKEYHKGKYRLVKLEKQWNQNYNQYRYCKKEDIGWFDESVLIDYREVIMQNWNGYGLSLKQNAYIYHKYIEYLKNVGITKTHIEKLQEIKNQQK